MLSPSRYQLIRNVIVIGLAAVVLLALLLITGMVTAPFGRAHVRRAQLWLRDRVSSDPELAEEDDMACDCMWRIGCPKFAWQVNFTSPKFVCGFERLSYSLLGECLASRSHWHGRDFKLHLVGHTREAFLADFIRRRIRAAVKKSDCRLYQARTAPKNFSAEVTDECSVTPTSKGKTTCQLKYARDHFEMDFLYFDLMSPEVFTYVEELTKACQADGCEGDMLIISGGVGELLNSTLMDSFRGVRRFQRPFQKLLPMLVQLQTVHRMHVVWKLHEPVTDELIPDNSLVRNDLLQEYNALIMEQALETPIHVWTSHLLMKLHHIEQCDPILDTPHPNSADWRCEEELVGGDFAHDEYFDAIFNVVCDKMVPMPENPCCTA